MRSGLPILLYCILLCSNLSILQRHVLGQIQPISVTQTQQCESVMVQNVRLSCNDTQRSVTIVDFLASAGVSSTNNLSLSIISIPAGAGSTQLGTTTDCTQKTAQGRCLSIEQSTLSVQISKPVVVFELEPVGLNFNVPLMYMYRSAFTPPVSPSDNCIFIGTSVSQNAALMNKLRSQGGQLSCPNPYDGNITYGPQGSSVLSYAFSLDQFFSKSVSLDSAFFGVQPYCAVMRARGRGRVVVDFTVTLTNEVTGEQQTVTIRSTDYNSARASLGGKLMLRIVGIRTLNEFTNPIDRGLWLVCGNGSSVSPDIIEPVNMAPVDWNPIDNPWKQLSVENRRFAMPTQQMILQLNGRATNPAADAYSRSFAVYINSSIAPAYCTECGCYGVDADIISNAPQQLYLEQYLRAFSDDINIPCNQLLNIQNLNTCVPGFGASYRGITPASPCQALNYFHQRNDGNASYREQQYVADGNKTYFVSPYWISEEPNQWMIDNRVYLDMPQLSGALYEAVVYFTGDFAAVVNPAGFASAEFDRQKTFCQADVSAAYNSAYINAVICNSATSGGPGNYILYTTCRADSNLAPVPPARISTTNPLASGQCVALQQALTITGNIQVGGSYVCSIQVTSADASVSFTANTSLVLDRLDLGCIAGSIQGINNSIIGPFTLQGNLSRQTNETNPATNKPDTTTAWIITGVAIGVVAAVGIVFGVTFIIVNYAVPR